MRKLDDWITAYLEYTKETESPDSYHIWSALVALSAALGLNWPNVTTNTPIFNNLFVILIAAQGSTRKSTSLKVARNLIRDDDLLREYVTVASETESEAALLETFAESAKRNPKKHANFFVANHELHNLVVTSGVDIINTLMSIYDENTSFAKNLKSSGRLIIESPYLNLLAATTPTYLGTAFTEDIRNSGMTSRTIFVYEEKSRFLNPIYNLGGEDLRRKLVGDLRTIAQMPFETISFESRAFKNIYKPIYMDRERREKESPYALQKAFIARSDNHLIKVSALFALSRGHNVVESEDLERAIAILDDIEKDLPTVDQLLGQDKHASTKQNFEVWMKHCRKVTLSAVYHRYRKEMNIAEVDSMVGQYVAARMITNDGKRLEWIRD